MAKSKPTTPPDGAHPMFSVNLPGVQLQRTISVAETNIIPTRDPNFNKILGGGIPTMGITELWGGSGGGKSTGGIEITRSFLKTADPRGCVWIDAEYSTSTPWMNKCGIPYDLDSRGEIQYVDVPNRDGSISKMPLLDPNLGFLRPPAGMSGNKIFLVIRDLVRSDTVKLIVLDSLAALVPEQDLVGADKKEDLASNVIGSFARMVGSCLKQLRPYLIEYQVQLVYINQLRAKLTNYGSIDTSPGGRAAEHYRDLSIQFIRLGESDHYNENFESVTSGQQALGFKSRLIAKRSKVGVNRLSSIEIGFSTLTGIDNFYNSIAHAKAEGYLYTSGSMSYIKLFTPDESGNMFMKFRGKEQRLKFIRDNPEWWEDYCQQIGTAELSEYEASEEEETAWAGRDTLGANEEEVFSATANGTPEEVKAEREGAGLDELN